MMIEQHSGFDKFSAIDCWDDNMDIIIIITITIQLDWIFVASNMWSWRIKCWLVSGCNHVPQTSVHMEWGTYHGLGQNAGPAHF